MDTSGMSMALTIPQSATQFMSCSVVGFVYIYLWSVKVCSQCCNDIEPSVVQESYV